MAPSYTATWPLFTLRLTHQDGTLIELEAKWGIKATAYLAGYNERMGDWLAD